MLTEILQRPEFQAQPPILLDIGASFSLPLLWKEIAPYCICVAFDGDERDFNYIQDLSSKYKKLIIVNKVVSSTGGDIDFYLTSSPYCSSTLKTDSATLSNYAFADLFEIKETVKMGSVKLSTILFENKINYIDWFKTDTQGTDLRIIQSLDKSLIDNVILYELEPGIIDAYISEDKLYSVLEFFNCNKFIAIDATIKGSQRINIDLIKNKLPDNIVNEIHKLLPSTPDWCEISFFNSFMVESFTLREYLLGWVFATLKSQYGLALEIAEKGYKRYDDIIFHKMIESTLNDLKIKFEQGRKIPTFKRRLINFLERL